MKRLLISAIGALLFPLSISLAEPLKVVTSFSILEDFAQNIGQEKIDVESIIKADQDAHSFEPTPKDIIKIQNADVVILNGVEFDSWLNKILEANRYEGIIVNASHNVPLLPYHEDENHHDHGHDHDHDHHHGEFDPHIWQDPKNVIIMTENIRNGLTLAQPESEAYFENNFEAYKRELEALNNYAKHLLKDVNHNGKLMILHDSFGYLAKAYDLHFVAVSHLNPLAEPSAKRMSELYQLVKKENIRAIFSENIAPSRFIKTLAKDLNLQDGGILYSDALTTTPPANNYIGLFKHNIDQITAVLQDSSLTKADDANKK
ncbi:manganese ABC transporter substrate-binding lipoprotein [Ignatzschineria cameli]|uniref:metal ABC transporter substrate-binding protein n=1 Tax=Ignatzschineria cameli TaxID=2182793 RepID=UPI000D60AD30|nr:metal ABC transporter substrate-binding protein [Ignatzschineria cameli]PWD88705.1 manganese ABC transporter substrate-binding lipoprotein [Ignatzschineria cameli]